MRGFPCEQRSIVTRRYLLYCGAAGLCAFASSGSAQAKPPLVAWLGLTTASVASWEAFRAALRELGYEEHRSVTLIARSGGSNAELREHARALVANGAN